MNFLKTCSHIGKCVYENTHVNSLFIRNQGNCIFKTCCILFIVHKITFHNFIWFCSNNTVCVNRMLKFKYPLAVIVHFHILHFGGKICFAVYCTLLLQKCRCIPDAYCGKPVCIYFQQTDRLIRKIKTAVGVQFLIWGAFHCICDDWKYGHHQNFSSGFDQIFLSTVLLYVVQSSSGSCSDMVTWSFSKISFILVPSFFKICMIMILWYYIRVVEYRSCPVSWHFQVVSTQKCSVDSLPSPTVPVTNASFVYTCWITNLHMWTIFLRNINICYFSTCNHTGVKRNYCL
jgi:hypothetical protein